MYVPKTEREYIAYMDRLRDEIVAKVLIIEGSAVICREQPFLGRRNYFIIPNPRLVEEAYRWKLIHPETDILVHINVGVSFDTTSDGIPLEGVVGMSIPMVNTKKYGLRIPKDKDYILCLDSEEESLYQSIFSDLIPYNANALYFLDKE